MADVATLSTEPKSLGKSKLTFQSQNLKDLKRQTETGSPIPVVPILHTDEAVGLIEGEVLRHLNVEKFAQLLEDKHSVSLIERHVFALRKLARSAKHGFHLRDLPHIMHILHVLTDRYNAAQRGNLPAPAQTESQSVARDKESNGEHISSADSVSGNMNASAVGANSGAGVGEATYSSPLAYAECIHMLIRALEVPFLVESSSEETSLAENSSNALSDLGKLLPLLDDVARLEICKAVFSQHELHRKVVSVHKHRSIRQEYFREIVSNSTLPEAIAVLVEQTTLPELRMRSLEILQAFTSVSKLNCRKLTAVNAAYTLCAIMCEHEEKGALGFGTRHTRAMLSISKANANANASHESQSSSSVAGADKASTSSNQKAPAASRSLFAKFDHTASMILPRDPHAPTRSVLGLGSHIGSELLFRCVHILWNLLEADLDLSDKDLEGSKLAKNRTKAALQISNLHCLTQLRDAFVGELTQGHSHFDRQLRNDILSLCCLLAEANPLAPFIETAFAKHLILFASYPELKSHSPLVKKLKLSHNHEDFELKKLLFNMLVLLARDTAFLALLSEGHALLALFSYLQPPDTLEKERRGKAAGASAGAAGSDGTGSSTTLQSLSQFDQKGEQSSSSVGQGQGNMVSMWSLAFFEELQLHALFCIAQLAPRLLTDYFAHNGGTRLLMLLDWCLSPDAYMGYGNSFFGAGGRENKRAQLRQTLQAIRALVASGDEKVHSDFCDQGLIPMLTDIIGEWNRKRAVADIYDVQIECDMLFILAAVCELDYHRKELFGTSGVQAVLGLLEQATHPLTAFKSKSASKSKLGKGGEDTTRAPLSKLTEKNASSAHLKLVEYGIEAVASCVLGCPFNEDFFLEHGGVFLLLDILESLVVDRRHYLESELAAAQQIEMHSTVLSHRVRVTEQTRPAVNAILTCLVDLAENAKSLAHLHAWSGRYQENQFQTDPNALGTAPVPISATPGGHSHSETQRISMGAAPLGTASPSSAHKSHVPKQSSTARLMCELWRAEEIWLGVEKDPESGVLVNTQGPILTKAQRSLIESTKKLPTADSSEDGDKITKAISDIGENLRSKIYALFYRLGFADLQGLRTEDQVTLAVIDKYLDWKTAEVWAELVAELGGFDYVAADFTGQVESSGGGDPATGAAGPLGEGQPVRPITPDREAIRLITRASEENAEGAGNFQLETLEAERHLDGQVEQRYYAELRETHQQKEKAINAFNQFVARTSRHAELRAAKQRQLGAVDASRLGAKYRDETENRHAVEIENLSTTVLCSKNVFVQSTPKEMLLVSRLAHENENPIENQLFLEFWQRAEVERKDHERQHLERLAQRRKRHEELAQSAVTSSPSAEIRTGKRFGQGAGAGTGSGEDLHFLPADTFELARRRKVKAPMVEDASGERAAGFRGRGREVTLDSEPTSSSGGNSASTISTSTSTTLVHAFKDQPSDAHYSESNDESLAVFSSSGQKKGERVQFEKIALRSLDEVPDDETSNRKPIQNSSSDSSGDEGNDPPEADY